MSWSNIILLFVALLSISSLASASCKQECDYWYDACQNDTHHTSNDVSGGADDVYPAYKYGVANLYYCGKYDSSYRQEFMRENPGFDVGQCDCVPSYLACLKSLYEKYSSYEETGTHAKQCAVPAAACYNAFRATTCTIEKAACYKRCGIQNTGGNTGGSGTGGTSSGGTSDPCATKSCDKDKCQMEGGQAVWYGGGTCVKGDCQYNRLICKAGCNKDWDGCAEQVPVDVFLMQPYDNQQIDSKGGPATVNVIGVIRGAKNGDFSKAMVSVPGVLMQQPLSMYGDRFSGQVDLPGPGQYSVKVDAYDSSGSLVSSAESKVYIGAMNVAISWFNTSATVMRDGREISFSQDMRLQPGDTVTVTNPSGMWLNYSDGTRAFLYEGVTLKYGEGGSVVLMMGVMEVDGNFAHSFDTRFGVVVMKGTAFTLDVDDFRTRVKMSKGSVTLFSLYDTVAEAEAGQYADIMRNGEITVYSSDGSAVESSKPSGSASAMDPSTHKAAGCCGGAAILLAIAAFSLRR